MSTSLLSQADEAPSAGALEDGLRAAAVDAAIGLYRSRAIDDVTVDDVAGAAGLDPADVRRLFPSLHDLLLGTVAVWHGRRNAALLSIATDLGAVAYLRAVVVANVADPGLMRLMMGAASIGATPGHPMGPVMRHQWVQFHATVQRALAQDIATGREPSTVEPAHGAEQLIAVYEGLQVQSLMRPNMDLLEAYDRSATVLREGWASSRTPAVWEL